MTIRALAVSVLVMSGCGSSIDSTGPSPSEPRRYDGEWAGTSSQGRPIAFTVSEEQKVTALTIGYNFSGCSGTNTFSNLNLDIGSPPATPTVAPGLGFGSGSPEAPNYMQMYGSFTSNSVANGSLVFLGFPGCGNATGIWSARKR